MALLFSYVVLQIKLRALYLLRQLTTELYIPSLYSSPRSLCAGTGHCLALGRHSATP